MKKETKKNLAIYGGSTAIVLLWKSLSTMGKFSVIRYWVLAWLYGYWTGGAEVYASFPTLLKIALPLYLMIIGPLNLYWFREYLWKSGVHSNSK